MKEKVTVETARILKNLGLNVSAPTIYESAKFLREELGADLVVSPKFNSKTGDRIGYFWRWSQRTDMIDNKTYRTFEGALSAGISKVLKPFKEYSMRKTKFKYGAVSSVYELEADNKLTAYAAMCCHFDRSAHLIALYGPKEIVKNDCWLNPMGAISSHLDEIFGGEGSFDRYLEEHREGIVNAIKSIKQIM